MSEVKSPSVALLLRDRKVAREVSNIFRAMDVLPNIYEEFNAFWFGTLEEVPTFALIDVTLFAEGDRSLASHPHIKAQSLPLAIYYTNATSPLTYTTFDTFHFGLVSGELPLSGQLKSILKRVNRFNSLEREKKEFELKAQGLQHQIDRVVRGTEKFKENDYYLQLLKRALMTFDHLRSEDDFNHALIQGFQQLNFVESFSVYELSFNAQKLISPPVKGPKYKELPSLWLGQTGYQGIEFYAQNMASQVALDMMGPNLMSLLLKGKRTKPEVVLFIQTNDEELLNQFDWSVLEHYLTGLYSHYELKKGKLLGQDKKQMSPWEFYSFLDSCFMGKLPGDSSEIVAPSAPYSLVNLNFADLNEAISSTPLLRFYWSKFAEDFVNKFESSKSHKFRFSSFGTEQMVFIVDQENSDNFFNDLKSFSLRFPIWRYFEEPEIILAKNLKPDITMVPLSTMAYQKFLAEVKFSQHQQSFSQQKISFIRSRQSEITN
ncbi:MAG: hypothetical protein Fur0010_19960 [Bdellovibrio sp.]